MRGTRRWWQVALAVLVALGLIAAHGGAARANGEPVEIDLRYLEGVANFGPRDATGRVRIVKVEGDVRLTATKLPPQPGARYEGWIINTKTNEHRSVGKFDPAPDGTVSYTALIENFGEPEFDLFIVTLEPEPDPSPAPDARVVLAGRRVVLGPAAPVMAVPRDGAGRGGAVPVVALPRTGAPADPVTAGALAPVLAFAGALGALAAAAWRRR